MACARIWQMMKPRLPAQRQRPIPYPAIWDGPTQSLKTCPSKSLQKRERFFLFFFTAHALMIFYRLVKLNFSIFNLWIGHAASHGFGGWTAVGSGREATGGGSVAGGRVAADGHGGGRSGRSSSSRRRSCRSDDRFTVAASAGRRVVVVVDALLTVRRVHHVVVVVAWWLQLFGCSHRASESMDFFLVNCSFQEKMAADTEHKTGGLFTRNFDSDKR